jgi:hypothetical protein
MRLHALAAGGSMSEQQGGVCALTWGAPMRLHALAAGGVQITASHNQEGPAAGFCERQARQRVRGGLSDAD